VNVPRGADRDGPWPDGSRVSVSLTFDVDAEAALLGLGLDEATRYSAFTERRFGIARGLPRVLALLAEHGIRGTFYVPGYTADRYPDDVSAIVEGGHEVAHHGYFHLPPTGLDPAGQREELERGKAALEKLTGRAPKGYRSPSWDVTEETFSLLGELGFEYDSSCMGDDRPYIERLGRTSLVELPVHWSLDDFPYYSWGEAAGGLMSDPSVLSAVWMSEFRVALREGGHVTYTAHPEISGRRSRFEAFQSFVEGMRSTADVWFATHGEIAGLLRASVEGTR
jgi:peptidoglycan/xylan/chitin deacetylase (PgdA/CDA1 family)